MSEFDDLEARLRALGAQPIDPAVQSRHLTAMTSVHWRRTRLGRARVVAAFAAGLVLGGTGLASAGALGPVQDPVADAAAKVGLNLPGGTERVNATNTPTACKVDGTTSPTTFRNHGQYVKAGGDPKDPCGKPLVSQQSDGGEGDEQRSECAPPWTGEGKPTAEQKAQWKAERPASCASDEAGTVEGPPADPGANSQKPDTPPGQEGKDGAGAPAGAGGQGSDPTLPDQANDRADDHGPAPTTTTTSTSTSTTTTSTTTTTTP